MTTTTQERATLPDTDDLAAKAAQFGYLCELATDLVDHLDRQQSHIVPQLHALLYTMHESADHLTAQIDRLNEGIYKREDDSRKGA